MNTLTRSYAASLFAAASLAAGGALAAPQAVEAFDAATWRSLQTTLKQPTVVVFSATYCANCPAVIDGLTREIRQRKLKAQLMAVVMDVTPGDDDAALKRNAHYKQADRLFAFAGQAPTVRYAVDPGWRGVTPYVVFLTPGAPAMAVTGPPTRADIQAWLQAWGAVAAR